jgi:hypothetical protein
MLIYIHTYTCCDTSEVVQEVCETFYKISEHSTIGRPLCSTLSTISCPFLLPFQLRLPNTIRAPPSRLLYLGKRSPAVSVVIPELIHRASENRRRQRHLSTLSFKVYFTVGQLRGASQYRSRKVACCQHKLRDQKSRQTTRWIRLRLEPVAYLCRDCELEMGWSLPDRTGIAFV